MDQFILFLEHFLAPVSFSWIPEISFLVSMLVAVVSLALSLFLWMTPSPPTGGMLCKKHYINSTS